MLQDIEPHSYQGAFIPRAPTANDAVVILRGTKVLTTNNQDGLDLPRYAALALSPDHAPLQYLMCIDDIGFFFYPGTLEETEQLHYRAPRLFREQAPHWLAFACVTACHVAHWYDTRRFCGKCAIPLQHKEKERALVCPACKTEEYPKIAPAVIVAIHDGSRILLTRYAQSPYTRYALVAGFVEIGETLEDAVHREVAEEVGLRIKNLRYVASQPWGITDSLLMGFFAELEGSDSVTLDQTELSEARWFERAQIPTDGSTLSLTWTLIEAFRSGVC